RKSVVFLAACSGVRNSVPASGRNRNRPNRLWPVELVNLNAVTAKYACRAKLVGMGLGASTKALAAGWEARNETMGGALGAPGPLATIARNNPRNSSPLRTGKPLRECPMMSVWTWSPRWNRTAIPWGLDASGLLSAAVGTPDVSENRTVTGVEGRMA